MRTTLKRGVGRGAASNGSNRAALPPGPLGPVTVYRQPPPPPRPRGRLALQIFGWAALVLCVLVGGTAGGAYLYLHESVAAVAPKSKEVKEALKSLDVALPGQPAVALVIGYDHRADEGKNTPSRSDTLMLVRADPDTKAISLLSFPRDLSAQIDCPGHTPFVSKINAAYATCGPKGALRTVRNLTGVPINYIITVNFRGFRQLVDKVGGVWMDVDRRYFNDHGGPYGYAKINLQPGYQRLTGLKALDFVRFRHTDSDIYRTARQQLFVKALKDRIESSFSLTKLPQLIKVITSNVEVGQGGGKNVDPHTVLQYAALAYSLPAGHVFQERIEGLEGFADLTTSQDNIDRAVRDFENPDVESPQKATAVALGEKIKRHAPPPRDTSVIALNGNGVTGAASSASYLLSQRGYRTLVPANGLAADAPNYDYFRTQVYFDRSAAKSKLAATKIANLFGSADVAPLVPKIRRLSNGAMVTVVLGQTFHGRLASAPVDQTPQRQPASVTTYGASDVVGLLRDWRRRIDFPMMVPTKLADGSSLDPEKPMRVYRIDPDGKHKAIRLTYRLAGGNEYWGVQMTDWDDAPVLGDRNFVRRIGGRRYELYYNGAHLHMVVLRTDGASYWVVNTLLDRLSNETMIAIAKGMRPLAKVSKST
jgi:LCP family protein required for cell wall assembly